MSKVFITKNGQFVSRGEGVLTRIENPDLEVNDIGVEVSERIAEDVKEGDVLFKNIQSVDIDPMSAPNDAYLFERSATIHDGVPYIFGCNINRRLAGYKYEDGQWISIPENPYGTEGMPSAPIQVKSISLNGRLLIFVSFGPAPYLDSLPITIKVFEYVNGVARLLKGDIPWDPDMFRGSEIETEQVSVVTQFDVLEFEDEIHVFYPTFVSSDSGLGVQKIKSYTYDIDNENFVDTNTSSMLLVSALNSPPGNNPPDQISLFDASGVLYSLMSTGMANNQFQSYLPTFYLFKWDPLSSSWSIAQTGNDVDYGNKNYPISVNHRQTRISKVGDDIYASFVYGNTGSYNDLTYRFDPVAERFNNLFVPNDFSQEGLWSTSSAECITGNPASRTAPVFFKDGSSIYVVRDIATSGNKNILLARYHPDTSSFEDLDHPETFQLGTSNGNADSYCPSLTFVEHNDEKFIIVSYYRGPYMDFFKWNSETQLLERFHYWKTLHDYSNTLRIPHTIMHNGKRFFANGAGVFRFQSAELITSGEGAGSFKYHWWPDIIPNVNHGKVKLKSDEGGLYAIRASEGAATSAIWIGEFNEDEQRFKKLADPSSIPFTPARYFYDAELSGVLHMIFMKWTTPYEMQHFTFSGGVFELVSTSSLPVQFNTGGDMINFEGNLIQLHSTISHNPSLYSMIWDGSSWNSVNFNLSSSNGWRDLNTANTAYAGLVRLYVHNEDLYAMIIRTPASTHWLFKWDKINNEWIDSDINQYSFRFPEARYVSPIYEVNGHQYMMISNLTNSTENYAGYNMQILKLGDDGRWDEYPFYRAAGAEGIGLLYEYDNKVNVLFNGASWNSTRSGTLSEYAGEYVWDKKPSRPGITDNPIAYGIALQDGSKGDIIKIRRIKQ